MIYTLPNDKTLTHTFPYKPTVSELSSSLNICSSVLEITVFVPLVKTFPDTVSSAPVNNVAELFPTNGCCKNKTSPTELPSTVWNSVSTLAATSTGIWNTETTVEFSSILSCETGLWSPTASWQFSNLHHLVIFNWIICSKTGNHGGILEHSLLRNRSLVIISWQFSNLHRLVILNRIICRKTGDSSDVTDKLDIGR